MARRNPGDLHWIEGLADEGYGEFEDYYEASARGELEPSDPYYGRNVIWDGIDGRMVRVDPDYLTAITGNIFDPDKLAAIVSGIDNAEDRVVFTAPYGQVSVVTPIDIKESIEYRDDETLDRPLTTGDDEIDEWLVDPEAFLDRAVGADQGERDELNDEMNGDLAEMVRTRQGDLGQLLFNIRDGNHRAFGALIAGEPYVYMIVMENQLQELDPEDPHDQIILDALE